jgi:histidinol-phosphatase (PHP family)
MFYPQNLHTHGVLCDGKNEYEDTVQKAIELGLTSLGFSGHSYTEYSNGLYCMTEENTPRYKKEIARLKEKYKDKLEIFCGLEFDMYSEVDLSGYDYLIGSMHYFKINGEYVGFDRSAEVVKEIIDKYFDGNGMEFAKRYYSEFSQLTNYGNFDIIGHFDLITKNLEISPLFDADCDEYYNAAFNAIDVSGERYLFSK